MEEGWKDTSVESVAERNREQEARIKDLDGSPCVHTTGTTGPGKTGEHKKRAKRESWKRSVAVRKEDKEVVLLYCWMRDAGPWDL